MSEKSPAFQFYPKDYESDEKVKAMSLEQEGAYLRLLCHGWLEGSIPADTPSLARICRVPPSKMARLWPGLAPCFKDSAPGRLTNPRQERDRAKARRFKEERAESGRKGAKSRWPNKTKMAQPRKRNGSAMHGSADLPLANEHSPFPSPFPSASPVTDNDNGLPPAADDPDPKTPTWSSEAADDWLEVKGGRAPARIFPALKQAVTSHGWDDVRPVWRYYLGRTPGEYVDVTKFVSMFGEWKVRSEGLLPPGREPRRIPL